jgi:hypothetical protein
MLSLSKGTDLAAGLLMGLEEQISAAKEQQQRQASCNAAGDEDTKTSCSQIYAVLLCTDGHPTSGLRRRGQILAAQREVMCPTPTDEKAAQSNRPTRIMVPMHAQIIPVSQWPAAQPKGGQAWSRSNPIWAQKGSDAYPMVNVNCFGFGEDHDPYLLQDIAAAAGGSYYFVRSPHDVPAAVADCLGGLMSVFATNVHIRVSPRGGAAVVNVLSGFPQRREGGEVVVRVHDMYMHEHKDLLVDFRLPEWPTDAEKSPTTTPFRWAMPWRWRQSSLRVGVISEPIGEECRSRATLQHEHPAPACMQAPHRCSRAWWRRAQAGCRVRCRSGRCLPRTALARARSHRPAAMPRV